MASCARCGKDVDEAKLLFSDVGRICGECELALGDEEGEFNANWTLAVGGPLMAFTGGILVVAGFMPYIGLATAGIAPIVAIIAIVLGVQAFLKSGEAPQEMRTLLVLCGALAVPGGIIVLVSAIGMVALQMLALATYGGWY